MNDLKEMYRRRFGDDIEFRAKLWAVLCNNFFQKYVPENSVVLDVGAGYCEFINNIKSSRKIALDMNPDINIFAQKDIEVVLSRSTDMQQIEDSSIDVVFTSNFFEHLSKEDIVKTVKEIYRVLKDQGRFLILQPNIRYCFKDYWIFFDHITPLDDRSLSEVLELNGFQIEENIPRFLPYSTKAKIPKSIYLLKIYLKIPILQKIFGKQAFIFAIKQPAKINITIL